MHSKSIKNINLKEILTIVVLKDLELLKLYNYFDFNLFLFLFCLFFILYRKKPNIAILFLNS
jgi:hypothetical protein